jgi:NAD(P)-dependent dehydrogenase (short-subunit alcohol dehydrogenase family)
VRLEGKAAVVTGAARGFGRAIAERFAEEGASVVLGDVLVEEGEEAAAAIKDSGGTARFVRADVTSPAEVAAMIDLAEKDFGHLDIVVANAGIVVLSSMEDMTEEQFDRQVGVNLKGTWLTLKLSLPALRRAGGGSIVVTASAAAFKGLAGSLYGATKAAAVMLTRNLALALGKDHIRCNAVAPGPVATELYGFSDAQSAAWVERWTPEVPLGFLGSPRDVADATLYLASDEARWVTGAVLAVDGGFTI